MKKFFNILRECPLFNDIEDCDLTAMLGCLKATNAVFKKGETILCEGESATHFGIVLSGRAQIMQVDYYGNRTILTMIESSELFGESFACANIKSLPVDVVAAEDTEVLLIDAVRITQSCNNACSFHNRMIFNLLKIVATKNLIFHQKIEITSKRSTREKLMSYLLLQAKQTGNSTFNIPYDRQELADYLEVERSGLSAEISKLRKEKIIECKKNEFTLL